MIFPTISQVREKMVFSSKNKDVLHNLPLTNAEISKIKSFKGDNAPKVIDTPQSIRWLLQEFDSTFGKFVCIEKNKLIFRGKMDFKKKFEDPETGEKQIIFTVSDPKTLYRPINTNPVLIRVPEKSNLLSGVYAEVEVPFDGTITNNTYLTGTENIKPINFEVEIPSLIMDYGKFGEIFKTDYHFELDDSALAVKRNFRLSNADLMLLNKVAGENFHEEVKGGVCCSIVKQRYGWHYDLEVLDYFLNMVTYNHNTESVFNQNMVSCGGLNHFGTVLNKNNRLSPYSPYKNYYGCDIGFSLKKELKSKEVKFLETFEKEHSNMCIDFINPIGSITTPPKSYVKKLLRSNKDYVYGSQALFLEAQLLPVKARVNDISSVEPKVLRAATMFKKFEDCIDNLGRDEVLTQLKLTKNNIDIAKKSLKENKKSFDEFMGLN